MIAHLRFQHCVHRHTFSIISLRRRNERPPRARELIIIVSLLLSRSLSLSFFLSLARSLSLSYVTILNRSKCSTVAWLAKRLTVCSSVLRLRSPCWSFLRVFPGAASADRSCCLAAAASRQLPRGLASAAGGAGGGCLRRRGHGPADLR